MQEHTQLTQKQINDDLLRSVFTVPRWWPGSTLILLLIFIAGACAFGYMINKGIGVTGLNRPAYWGVYIVNFVFWNFL